MYTGRNSLDYEQYTHLFNEINVPVHILQQWLLVPEFVEEVSALYENQQPVTNETIYPIMEGICSEYDSEVLSRGYHINGANFRDLRKSVQHLYKVLNSKQNQKKR